MLLQSLYEDSFPGAGRTLHKGFSDRRQYSLDLTVEPPRVLWVGSFDFRWRREMRWSIREVSCFMGTVWSVEITQFQDSIACRILVTFCQLEAFMKSWNGEGKKPLFSRCIRLGTWASANDWVGFCLPLGGLVLKIPPLVMQADKIINGSFLVALKLWFIWESLKYEEWLLFFWSSVNGYLLQSFFLV